MSITYPITLPTSPAPAQIELSALTVGGKNLSPYTLSQEVFEWPGNRWLASVRYPKMTRVQADAIIAALVSLYGVGTLLLGPIGTAKAPKGSVSSPSFPAILTANQSGKSVSTYNWNSSSAGVLKAGDFIQLQGTGGPQRLHLVLTDANSDGSGLATLDIWPRLRESPAINSQVVVSAPKGLFRLASNQMKWDVNEANLYGLTFDAEEAL